MTYANTPVIKCESHTSKQRMCSSVLVNVYRKVIIPKVSGHVGVNRIDRKRDMDCFKDATRELAPTYHRISGRHTLSLAPERSGQTNGAWTLRSIGYHAPAISQTSYRRDISGSR